MPCELSMTDISIGLIGDQLVGVAEARYGSNYLGGLGKLGSPEAAYRLLLVN